MTEPKLYTKDGSVIERRRRFNGEFKLEVVMDRVLAHGDAVALTYKDARVDPEKNLFFVLFDKVQITTQEQSNEGSLDDIA